MVEYASHRAAAIAACAFALWVGPLGYGDQPAKPSPLSIRDAEPIARKWAFHQTPNLNPKTNLKLEEIKVDQLWDKLEVQLFRLRLLVDEAEFNSMILLCHKRAFQPFADTLGGNGLMSGVVIDDDFYYTYSWGSGIHRSHVGKLSIVKGKPRIQETGGFRDRDLFVKKGESQIILETASREDQAFKAFNSWRSAKAFGTLQQRTDALEIIGSDGKTGDRNGDAASIDRVN